MHENMRWCTICRTVCLTVPPRCPKALVKLETWHCHFKQETDTQKIRLDFPDGSSLRLRSDSDVDGSDNGRVIDAEYRDAV